MGEFPQFNNHRFWPLLILPPERAGPLPKWSPAHGTSNCSKAPPNLCVPFACVNISYMCIRVWRMWLTCYHLKWEFPALSTGFVPEDSSEIKRSYFTKGLGKLCH